MHLKYRQIYANGANLPHGRPLNGEVGTGRSLSITSRHGISANLRDRLTRAYLPLTSCTDCR